MEEDNQVSPPETSSAKGVGPLAQSEEAATWQARATYLQAQAERCEAARAALQEKVLALSAQLSALQAHAADLQTRLAQAEARLQATQSSTASTPRLARSVARPRITDLVDVLPRHPDCANQYAQRPLAHIQRLVLHHSGSADPAQTPQQMAEFHINDLKHQWPGIGFHFFIAAGGTVYQTNRLETACFHVANSNATTAGIVLAGDFSASAPNAAQMASTAALLAWLLQELRLPLGSVVGHNEFPEQQTDCPGSAWLESGGWREALLAQVRQQMQTTRPAIYHYVLFSQTEPAQAEADWQAAAEYVTRFRATAGFSADEAAKAENVTIVGGAAGATAEVEEALHATGCRVYRAAAKNAKESRALLDSLAHKGQRFPAP